MDVITLDTFYDLLLLPASLDEMEMNKANN